MLGRQAVGYACDLVSILAQQLIEQACERWPEIQVDLASLDAHLQSLGHTTALPSRPLELFLAFAAMKGDSRACAELERTYLAEAGTKVRFLVQDAALVDDVLQRVREKLWIGPPPALASYTGNSSLNAWLNTIAKRSAIDELRAQTRKRARMVDPGDERVGEAQLEQTPERAQESLLDIERQHASFQQAVAHAIRGLSTRDRLLLKLHYRDGVSADALGKTYGVHRATVTRWLIQLRAQVFAAAQSRVGEEQQLSEQAFRSLAGKLHNRLDLVISSWEGDSGEEP